MKIFRKNAGVFQKQNFVKRCFSASFVICRSCSLVMISSLSYPGSVLIGVNRFFSYVGLKNAIINIFRQYRCTMDNVEMWISLYVQLYVQIWVSVNGGEFVQFDVSIPYNLCILLFKSLLCLPIIVFFPSFIIIVY